MRIRFSLALLVLLACCACSAQSTLPGPVPGAQKAPRFEAGACPKTPEPIEELKTARCGLLVVPENRAIPSTRVIRLAVAIVRSRDLHRANFALAGEFACPMLARGRLGEPYAPDESAAVGQLAHGIGVALNLLGPRTASENEEIRASL